MDGCKEMDRRLILLSFFLFFLSLFYFLSTGQVASLEILRKEAKKIQRMSWKRDGRNGLKKQRRLNCDPEKMEV